MTRTARVVQMWVLVGFAVTWLAFTIGLYAAGQFNERGAHGRVITRESNPVQFGIVVAISLCIDGLLLGMAAWQAVQIRKLDRPLPPPPLPDSPATPPARSAARDEDQADA